MVIIESILTGIRLPAEVEAFYQAYANQCSIIKVPLLDTGHDAEIEASFQSGTGIIILLPIGQIDLCVKEFLKAHVLPTLVLAVHADKRGKPLRFQAELLGEMRASLDNIGITHIRIEYLHLEPDTELRLNTGLESLLLTFGRAATYFRDMPEVLFCSTPEVLDAYIKDRNRVREETERFSYLRNTLDVGAIVRVQRDYNDWHFAVVNISSSRLELTDDELISHVQEDLNHASVSDAMGLLMPLQIQMVMSESLNRWLLSKKIGAACDIELTLKCPDEETRFSIQQSPITIEVER